MAGAAGTSSGAGTSSTDDAALQAPFAKVNDVVPGSPADSAGLKAGDKILKFGDVNWMNHEKLSKLAETVAQNVEVSWPSQRRCSNHRSATDGSGPEADSDPGGQRGRERRAARPAADTAAQLGRQRDVGLPLIAAVDGMHGQRRWAEATAWHGRNGTVYYYELMARRRMREALELGLRAAAKVQRKCSKSAAKVQRISRLALRSPAALPTQSAAGSLGEFFLM